MKRASLLLAVFFALGSCSKQENLKTTSSGGQTTQATTNTSQPKTPKGNYTLSGGHPAWLAIDGGYCIPPGINCGWIDDPVSSADLVMLADAEDGGKDDVGSLFSGTFAHVEDDLGSTHYQKLASGDYYIKLNYESETKINYLCGTSNPLVFENMEFVIEFDKE